MERSADTVVQLMADFRGGDKDAARRLVELLYPELRRAAVASMRGERADHTWQPTVLINELYLALVKINGLNGGGGSNTAKGSEKAAFLGLAGQIMRRLLIDHSRPLYRRATKVEYAGGEELPLASAETGAESLQVVEEALARLAGIDPKFRSVVEMRVFEGLTVEEIAEQLGCSPRSVATYWAFARRWLERELSHG